MKLFNKGYKYNVTYLNTEGKEIEDTFTPEKDCNEVSIISNLKQNKDDFFKLIKVTESKVKVLESAKADYKTLTVTTRDYDNQVQDLLDYIKSLSMAGHTFNVVVDPNDSEFEKKFYIDGDGSCQVIEVEESEETENPEETKQNVEEVMNETEETDKVVKVVTDANEELDNLILDEQEAINGYDKYLETVIDKLPKPIYDVLETELMEIIKDEENHISKLEAIKKAFKF